MALRVDGAANEILYGEKVGRQQILNGEGIAMPDDA